MENEEQNNIAKPMIPSTVASSRFGVTNDYITVLCRKAKINGALVGRVWYIEPESLELLLNKTKVEREQRRTQLSQKLKEEYQQTAPVVAAPVVSPVVVTPIAAPVVQIKKAPRPISWPLVTRTALAVLAVGIFAAQAFAGGGVGIFATAHPLPIAWTPIARPVVHMPAELAQQLLAPTMQSAADSFTFALEHAPMPPVLPTYVPPTVGETHASEIATIVKHVVARAFSQQQSTESTASVASAWCKLTSIFTKQTCEPVTLAVATPVPNSTPQPDIVAAAPAATPTQPSAPIFKTNTAPAAAPQTIIKYVSTPQTLANNYVTSDVLNTKMQELDNQLRSLFYSQTSIPNSFPATGGFTNTIALSNKIDKLDGVTITNSSIDSSSIPVLNYFAATSTISIAYGGTGTSTAPGANKLLFSDSDGNWEYVATSSLGITSGSGSGGVGSGTAGQVPYYAASGTDLTATSTLFISTAGLVGVGTTSPAYKLDVQTSDNTGNSIFSIQNANTGSNAYTELLIKNDAGTRIGAFGTAGTGVSASGGMYDPGYAYFVAAGGADGFNIGSSKSTGVLRFFTGGSAASNERMRITSAGNIGIGTTSPYAKLSVGGQVVGAYFTATTSTTSIFPYASSTAISVSGTSFLTNILATASSTIGDGTAIGGLTINGAATTTGQIFASSGSNSAPGISFSGSKNSGFVQGVGGTGRITIVSAGTAMFYLDSSNNQVNMPSTALFGWSNAAPDSGSRDTSLSRLAAATIAVGGTSGNTGTLIAGTIGLGTTSPLATLSVSRYNGSGAPLFVIASSSQSLGTSTLFTVDQVGNTSIAGGLLAVASSTIGDGTRAGGLTVNGGATTTGALYLSSATRLNSTLSFYPSSSLLVASTLGTTGTYHMYLDIGNSGYGFAFYTAGGAFNINAQGGAFLGFSNGNASTYNTPDAGISRLGGGRLGVGTGASGASNGTLIAGAIGIGTTSPSLSLLTVATPNGSTGASTTLFMIASSTIAGATTTLFVVSNTGYVGIGTTSPGSLLDLTDASLTGGQLTITSTAGTNAAAGIILKTPYQGTSANGAIYTSYYGKNASGSYPLVQGMTFQSPRDLAGYGFNFAANSGGSKMFIDTTSGNVGIGSTTPLAQLSVNPNGLSGPVFAVGSSTQTLFQISNMGAVTIGNGSQTTNTLTFGTTGAVVSCSGCSTTVGAPAGNVYLGNTTSFGANVLVGSAGVGIVSTLPLAWTNDSTSYGTKDTSFSRFSSGVVAVGTGAAASTGGGLMALASSTIGGGTQTTGLTINGGATTTGKSYITSSLTTASASGNYIYMAAPSSNAGGYYMTGSSNYGIMMNTAVASVSSWALGYSSALTSTSPTSVLTWNDAGNAGVGSTTPWAQFSINPNGISGPAFAIGSTTSTLFTVTSGGLVGIGTASPGGNLEVVSGGATSLNVETTANNNALLRIKTNSSIRGYFGYSTSNGGTFGIFDGSANSVLAISSGNIGIGTTSPYAKLSVVGEAVARNFTATSTTATSTFAGGLNVGSGALTYDFSSGLTSIQNLALGSMSFDTDSGIVTWADMPVTSSATAGTVESYSAAIDGTNILTIYSEADGSGGITNGRIGIGTSSPQYVLDVASTTGAGSLARFTNATGNCTINPTNTALSCSSDQRLKKNILSITASPAATSTLAEVLALNPVMYNWNSEGTTSSKHAGFIAQEVNMLYPDLVSQDDNGFYALNYSGFAPYIVSAIKEMYDTTFERITAWLGSATNGITKLFAKEVHTENLCVKKSDGTDVCVTGDQLAAILAGQSSGGSNGGSGGSTGGSGNGGGGSDTNGTTTPQDGGGDTATSTPTDTVAPTITVNGNSPATVLKGTTYADLGVTVSDNIDQNLSVYAFVDGGATTTPEQLIIDTSAVGEHTVLYRVADNAGNVAEASRTVKVEEINITFAQPTNE